ncbi:DUF5695 domain-containing protein [Pedobacter rhizosphaerae]|uniref:Uncharacterized protein n=1 Tax=Pedobacter rhizosphaerae TaxID=390241 RepID=A0A1H9MT07_9SPHI|nr:DUF5695 domain-containing protein [Pedobacter rhizosphaerae]SER26812.1 hypothetical protein SAMN04488023_106133 [Pedobacter rhizosphaerae]
MNITQRIFLKLLFGLGICSFLINPLYAQSPWVRLAQKPSTLGLEGGYLSLDAGAFNLKLIKSSQTVAGLQPKSVKDFDFVPSDSLKVRSSDGLYHLGDINIRLRQEGNGNWTSYSTAAKRMPVKAIPAKGKVLAAADLSPTLPTGIPLQVNRSWEMVNGKLVLKFELKNKTSKNVEIGALGIPMIFDNILEGRTLEQTHAKNVFYDPYIGKDAGYLQVTRLSGHAPSLIVVPVGKTPFEAYNPLNDDRTPRGIAFEGFYEWMVYSKAYAENEWKNAEQWNTPTSILLKAGETKTYALEFILSGNAQETESKLIENKRPVAISVPGYVLPKDVDAKLFINYARKIKTIQSFPQNALTIGLLPVTKNGWKSYSIKGNVWGRAKLAITYEDGLEQTINYKIIAPETEVIASYGNFLTTKQWFDQPNDIFKRSPSAITYDYEKQQQVVQDNRAWIAGLSDEGGAGSWLGAIMKQLVLPEKTEIDKLQKFVDSVMFGQIQVKAGPKKYGVKKSLFFYEPDSMPKNTYASDINFKVWSAWPRKEADNLGRSYNYPHVAAAHWLMYRLARNYKGLVDQSTWKQHLIDAAQTGMAMVNIAPYYAQFGQMEGTIFYLILTDLKNEGLTADAEQLENAMKKRANHWRSLEYPFGSEMPWDSTGQEEVYVWSNYFGYDDKAKVTLDAILAYMPVVPHWAYNGNARRYWDFLYGGKLQRVERMIHHYGSALNAIPVLMDYRKNPDNFYLLRAGYGGLLGSISNITQDGFAPAAFHAYPSTLKNDGITGDYGSGFFGYAVNSASYILAHKEFGWLAFGGNLKKQGDVVQVELTTAAKSAVYIAPVGLWISLDAGKIESVSYNISTGELRLKLQKADQFTPHAIIRITQPAKISGVGSYQIKGASTVERGAQVVNLSTTQTTEVIIQK